MRKPPANPAHANPARPEVQRILRRCDRLETHALVLLTATGLGIGIVGLIGDVLLNPAERAPAMLTAGISSAFAITVWRLRAGTRGAACAGGVICLLLAAATQRPGHSILSSALVPLAVLFVLTFVATRLGRQRKQTLGLAEPAQGRDVAQVLANLGAAGLIAAAGLIPAAQLPWFLPTPTALAPLLILAALGEAAADTISSEIGQAFGGTPRLIPLFEPVPPGTDGAISLLGTSAGCAGAGLVTLSGALAMGMNLRAAGTIFLAASAGLFFDSLLGATVERRGILNNNLVNFFSTVFAAFVAWMLQGLV